VQKYGLLPDNYIGDFAIRCGITEQNLDILLFLRNMSVQNAILVAKLASGDREAYSYLYSEYFAKLGAYAMRFVPDQEEAQEIVQSVIVKLWENRNSLESVSNLQAYLYRMVHNACVNKCEKQRVRNDYKLSAMHELQTIALEDDDPIDDGHLNLLLQEIEKLPEQCRNVFKMKHLQGMKYKEIAGELGIGERTVETHLKRAMQALQKRLSALALVVLLFFFNWVSGIEIVNLSY